MLTHTSAIGIIGYGRFGRLMHHIMSGMGLSVKVYSRSQQSDNKTFFNKSDVYSCPIVIPSVPNSVFEETIKELAAHTHIGQIIIDVCSIKQYPKRIMLEHLPATTQILCTHPMFGPASYAKRDGDLTGLNVVLEAVRIESGIYNQIKTFLSSIGFNVVEMDAEEHDRLAARFHFLTNLVGSILKEMKLKRTSIDTASASAMFDFVEMLSTDKELVRDMYQYNDFCKQVLIEFDETFLNIKKFIK